MPNPPNPTTDIPRLPEREPTTHKGQVGRIGIIAGSRGMSGAAVLCGLGALRGGAGLVRVHTPASVHPIVAASEPCLMVVPLGPEDEHGALAFKVQGLARDDFDAWDVFAVGPGLGRSEGAWLLTQGADFFARALVLDADALNLIAASEEKHGRGQLWAKREGRPTIITPHPGEMARLRAAAGMPEVAGADDETRLGIAHEYAVYSGATVVLKGHRTVVCTPDRAFLNTTGNPGMAAGGMGDVLTGLIAALLGQGLDAFDAARLGVFAHGLAADRAAERIGPTGYLAREVADLLPAALAEASTRDIGFR